MAFCIMIGLATSLLLKRTRSTLCSWRRACWHRSVGLRMWPPVATRVSGGAVILNLLDNVVLEDIVRQAKEVRIQVEVTVLVRNIACLSGLPICKEQWWSWDAVLWVAPKTRIWKAWPEVAPIWLLGIANIASLAAKDTFDLRVQRPSCIDSCWLWAESDLERSRLRNCCGGRCHISHLQLSLLRRRRVDLGSSDISVKSKMTLAVLYIPLRY